MFSIIAKTTNRVIFIAITVQASIRALSTCISTRIPVFSGNRQLGARCSDYETRDSKWRENSHGQGRSMANRSVSACRFRDRRERARFGSYEAETKQPINQFSAGTIHPMRSE